MEQDEYAGNNKNIYMFHNIQRIYSKVKIHKDKKDSGQATDPYLQFVNYPSNLPWSIQNCKCHPLVQKWWSYVV